MNQQATSAGSSREAAKASGSANGAAKAAAGNKALCGARKWNGTGCLECAGTGACPIHRRIGVY